MPPKNVNPIPCDTIIEGIRQALDDRPLLSITEATSLPKFLLYNAASGHRNLPLAALKLICQHYLEYPDLPDIIANLVRDWLTETRPN